MRNRLAKRLRYAARLLTIGRPEHVTRAVYKRIKKEYPRIPVHLQRDPKTGGSPWLPWLRRVDPQHRRHETKT